MNHLQLAVLTFAHHLANPGAGHDPNTCSACRQHTAGPDNTAPPRTMADAMTRGIETVRAVAFRAMAHERRAPLSAGDVAALLAFSEMLADMQLPAFLAQIEAEAADEAGPQDEAARAAVAELITRNASAP